MVSIGLSVNSPFVLFSNLQQQMLIISHISMFITYSQRIDAVTQTQSEYIMQVINLSYIVIPIINLLDFYSFRENVEERRKMLLIQAIGSGRIFRTPFRERLQIKVTRKLK